ncbi:MAG: hypothetical protein HC906_00505 [Bacteroidales bacterium]|nr:hypothetical protein [Bacteroidales bacterium]
METGFSDLKIFQTLVNTIPPLSAVHLANSTPVRYAQLFPTRKDLTYFCNRGTSGIDGCVSTAVGFNYASVQPVTIITGDLAFIYDSNALWNKYLNNKFRIVVINNGGGNIFRLIDTSSEIKDIMEFFETPHQVNLKHLTEAYGVKYFFCDDEKEFHIQCETFF